MLEKALQYGKRVSIIPLKKDKRPYLSSWSEYQTRKSTEEEIREWWTKWPEANIGMVTGKISGVSVVDFDREKDANGDYILNGKIGDWSKFPETEVVRTGNGGRQFYYSYSEEAHTGTKRLPLTDIKNDGGYVVLPPSVTDYVNEKTGQKQGGKYEVLIEHAWTPFPSHLFGGVQEKVSGEWLNAVGGVGSGSRNDSGSKVIGKYLSVLPVEEWKTLGWDYAMFWNSKNTPPMSEYELKSIFLSISKREFAKRNSSVGGTIERLQSEVKTEDEKQRLMEIAKIYEGEDRMILSSELVEQIKNKPEELKIMSGISGLDSILKGFRPNQVIVVAAPTKNGKTSFCMDLTTRMKEYCPAWFPLEEGAEELLTKFIERGEEAPIFCTPASYSKIDLSWIENKIIEAIVKYGTKIVFIDHLHFIVPFSAERTDLRIGETMRALKGIAKRWGITIFLIAHLKKTKLESQPELDDLRDSSFIAQEADTVMFLWRQGEKGKDGVQITNNVNLSIQANRRTGGTGNVKMVYENGHFYEKEWEVKEDEKKAAIKKLIRTAKKEVDEEEAQLAFDNLN